MDPMNLIPQLNKKLEGFKQQGLPVDFAINSLNGTVKPALFKLFAEQGIGFVRRMGFKVRHQQAGKVVCSAPLKGNVNHIGTMYAGAMFTLAEVPGGVLCLNTFDTEKFVPIVTEMNIKYLKPGKSDLTVEVALSPAEVERIEQEATAKGKSDFLLNAQLKDKAGEVVAITEGHYQLRAKRWRA